MRLVITQNWSVSILSKKDSPSRNLL